MAIINMERECAEFGFKLVTDSKNVVSSENFLTKTERSKIIGTINKSLGILNSDGPFAFIVWLEYQGSLNPGDKAEEKTASIIHQQSFSLLKEIGFITTEDHKRLRDELTKENGLCDNIQRMFLVKGILEKMLTYALYNSKSLESKSEDSEVKPEKEVANATP